MKKLNIAVALIIAGLLTLTSVSTLATKTPPSGWLNCDKNSLPCKYNKSLGPGKAFILYIHCDGSDVKLKHVDCNSTSYESIFCSKQKHPSQCRCSNLDVKNYQTMAVTVNSCETP